MAEGKGRGFGTGAGGQTDQSVAAKLGLEAARSLFNKVKNFESGNTKVLKQLIQGQSLSHEDSARIQAELRKTREGFDLLRKSISGTPGRPATPEGRDAAGRFTSSQAPGSQPKSPVPLQSEAAAKHLVKGLMTPQNVTLVGPDGKPVSSEPASQLSLKEITSTMHDQLIAGDLTLEHAKSMALSLTQIEKLDDKTAMAMADLQKAAKDPKSKDTGLLLALLAAVKDTEKADEAKVDLDQMDSELDGILKQEKKRTERQEKKDREADTHLLGSRPLGVLTGTSGGQGINSLGDISGAINVGVSLGMLAIKLVGEPITNWVKEHWKLGVSEAQGVQKQTEAKQQQYNFKHAGQQLSDKGQETHNKIRQQLQLASKKGVFGEAYGGELKPSELTTGEQAFMLAMDSGASPDAAMNEARKAIYATKVADIQNNPLLQDQASKTLALNNLREESKQAEKRLPERLKEAKKSSFFGGPGLDISNLKPEFTPTIPTISTSNNTLPANSLGARLRKEEGFRTKVYPDSAGLPTVGEGHLLVDPKTGQPKSKMDADILRRGFVTPEEGTTIFQKDLQSHQAPWMSKLPPGTSPKVVEALSDLAFNAGPGAAISVVKKLNAGDTSGAINTIRAYNKITNPTTKKKEVFQPLVERREREVALFSAGLKDATGSSLSAMNTLRPSGRTAIPVTPQSPIIMGDSDISKKAAEVRVTESRNRSTPNALPPAVQNSNRSLPAPPTPKTTGIDDLALAILKNGMLESV